ncbi:hypothetical protein E4U15_006097 [Claviceps sp. LM218 group G6]|nr:hypothetical protein E4U15_006097 [Claviceps sp. LM218 group G6]
MVHKHRKIHEPYGSSRKACAHVWQTYHVNQPDQYIRTVIDTGETFLAICFTQEQAELWPKVHAIQMDMNYKKITGRAGQVEHEVIFGGRVGLEGQFLALARAYMSSQDAPAYEDLFRELFNCLERQCGVRVRWQHIHKEGLFGLTLDQDAAAIKDNSRLVDWLEHKKSAFISCGLSRAYSMLSRRGWNTLSEDTNGVESLHEQSYKAGGRYTSLQHAMDS